MLKGVPADNIPPEPVKRKETLMSAFLGPIHHWLYHKIQIQEELIHDILGHFSQENDSFEATEKLDAACGKLELLPLEESIDVSNIHGWLHEKIALTETRLAFLVTELLRETPSRLADLQKIAFQFGEKHALQDKIGADEALRALEDTLLDGMPCDHVNQVVQREQNKVIWKKTQCVHRDYWNQVGGDIAIYNALRLKIIEGMLIYSGLALHILENEEYVISRKEQQTCTV